METASVDLYYNKINETLSSLIYSARADINGNLQNKNVLMEGFYREFLNILNGWRLINANAEKQNAPGIDLIDRANRIAVQVSATCDFKKIQHSLNLFSPSDEENWHFLFVPVMIEAPKIEKTFKLPAHVTFNLKNDILDSDHLLRQVKDADSKIQWQLFQFVSLEKTALWGYLHKLLCRTRDNHPSFKLMQRDKIDKRLFPGVKVSVPWETYGKSSLDSTISPVWSVIRESWRESENHSIVIEGSGGIGKTVALFSIAEDQERYCPAPAVYVSMHRLVTREGQCVTLSDFCRSLSDSFGNRINELAEKDWDGGPQLLMLLDGFNEVPAAKQREILHMLNDWHLQHPGAQFITVSRPMDIVNLETELAGNPISVVLEPMTKTAVHDYLNKRNITPPPEGADIWKTLVYPLFLTLYVKTDRLMDRTVDGYRLAPKLPKSGGALIWNYLQREMLREENEAWALLCTIACEYILPYIAYHMIYSNKYTIRQEEVKKLIIEALKSLNFTNLPLHLTDVLETYREQNDLEYPDFSDIKWYTFVAKETGVLVPGVEKGTLSFMHQHFRDCFAGLFLVNQAEMMKNGDEPFPPIWKKFHLPFLLDYAAELLDEKTFTEKLWETNRRRNPTDRTSTVLLLEIRKRRKDWKELNFSGMDLRGINLTNYMERDSTKSYLFRDRQLTVGTKMDQDTFRSDGHSDYVNCIAMMSDGLCVSGSNDNTLRVWNTYTGEYLQTLRGHTAPVRCVIAASGNLCVSGSQDCTARIWNPQTGRCCRILKGHTDWVTCITVTATGLCITGSNDHTLRVWNLKTGKCLHVLAEHTWRVNCVAVTSDGFCISGSDDKTLRVWNLNTGKCKHILTGHSESVNCVTVSPNNLCISGSSDHTLKIWNIQTGECLYTVDAHMAPVDCVVVNLNNLCISGSRDCTLHVWDLQNRKFISRLEGHENTIRCLAVTQDNLCISGSADETIRVWNPQTGECLHILKGHDWVVSCLAMIHDNLFISGSWDKTLRVWNPQSGECLHTLKKFSNGVNCVARTSDGLCVIGCEDGTVRILDPLTGKLVYMAAAHTGEITCLAVTSDGLCISGSSDSTLKVFSLQTGECFYKLDGHTDCVNCVAVTSDGLCVSSSSDYTLRVWNPKTGECLNTFKDNNLVECMAAAPEGICVLGFSNGVFQAWNPLTGEYLWKSVRNYTDDFNCMAVTPDGLHIIHDTDFGYLRVWNPYSVSILLIGHEDFINCVAVTPEGICVSGSDDTTLRTWNPYTGENLRTLKGHIGKVKCVAILSNSTCVSGSDDGTLRIWDLKLGKCMDVIDVTEVNVQGMDVSQAILKSDLAKLLWHNGAAIPQADCKFRRRSD